MNGILSGKKILLGITGGIAAYKSILLLRLLVKEGATVQVVMTPSAASFVSPLVLATLSKHPVAIEWVKDDAQWANHVMLGRWADIIVVAPATCNTISKFATGLCDNLLMAVLLSATCPVMIAPAMDEDMWLHAATNRNMSTLRSDGHIVLPVAHGELGSGLTGEGRMLEPEIILAHIVQMVSGSKPLVGLSAVVTAGPTHEPIDPVRFIGNHSSGLMGIEIANALQAAGAQTTLVLGPTHLRANSAVNTILVTTAQQMFDAVANVFPDTQIGVMAAAVADYRPATVADQKIKKQAHELGLLLVKNPDILQHCGMNKSANQLVVGFALETNNEAANAIEKLQRKNADMIVMNSLQDEGATFGSANNKVTIFEPGGLSQSFPLMSKQDLAKEIVSLIAKRIHEKA
jgi:phosphopantothenoylcysteine decarboxylase / phosphopantothenate---cysteine ligase